MGLGCIQTKRTALHQRMSKSYPSDLSDAEWEVLQTLLPVSSYGRPRQVDLRGVVNAILYILCSGCAWRYLPSDYPNYKTVYYYFARWREGETWTTIHEHLREWSRTVKNDRPPHQVWRWPIASRWRRLRWCQNPWVTTVVRR
jgi:putative transposase